MLMRSITLAATALALALPAAQLQAQTTPLQAVPRAGVAFPVTVTVRAKVESIDVDTRTIIFVAKDGRPVDCAVSDSVKNLDSVADGSTAEITYNEIVTVLNLRQKGPGAREARTEAGEDPGSGRFTLTVVGVDLANNKVSLIPGTGGEVRTVSATSVAQKDAIGKIKGGDVVIGMATPMLVTRIAPVQ